jgi:hypothetical protein
VTLDLPAGTVLQGDVTTGHLVEVKLVKTPSGWVLVSHTEDAPGDDDSPSGTTTGTTTTTSSTDDSPHGPDDSGHRGGRGR